MLKYYKCDNRPYKMLPFPLFYCVWYGLGLLGTLFGTIKGTYVLVVDSIKELVVCSGESILWTSWEHS